MTKELRERWNKFLENTRLYSAGQSDYYEFMEKEIIEAERRGREKMRREVIWQCERELAYNGAS